MNRIHISRRTLLKLAGVGGGSLLALRLAEALQVAPANPQPPAAPPYQGPPDLTGGGDGRRVLILGAGLAGLVAAYELQRAGYSCQVLEANTRPGGRIWTVRRGSESVESGGVQQVCNFDEGQFFEAGPNRIPQHHQAVMSYCKQFNLELELFTNINWAAYHYQTSGPFANQRLRHAEVFFDMLGYTAQLLAAAVQRNALDAEIGEARDDLLAYLKELGDLEQDYRYTGTGRGGYQVEPRAGLQAGEAGDPRPLSPLLQSELWRDMFHEWAYDEQMTLFHPVGGMDGLVQAFVGQVGPLVSYGAVVREIRRSGEGVRVVYESNGQTSAATGDFCICTIPPPVLAQIPADLLPGVTQALGQVRVVPLTTLGLQFNRRFWETDEEIFGGITWTDQPIGRIWYPTWNFFEPKGVLTGAYSLGDAALALGELDPAARIEQALNQGAAIHGQYRESFEQGFSVPWQRLPYSLGAYANYTPAERQTLYPALLENDGVIVLAGDYLSYLNGWMEGAVLSAHAAVRAVHERARMR